MDDGALSAPNRPLALIAETWVKIALLFGGLSGVYALLISMKTAPEIFFWRQDLPVLIGGGLFLALLSMTPRSSRLPGVSPRPAVAVWSLAIGALAVTGLMGPAVFEGYTLSLDEYLADFDAEIFRQGLLMAPVSPDWRPVLVALQPIYMLETPGNAFWASSYLPLNAAFRAAAGHLGAVGWLNPIWAAISILALYAVARRLWPDRPRMALAAALLLASSAQFLITAMTAYAMSAHLALNLVWLWLFLRSKPLSDAGAIGVGFIASGLHQVIFHPIFVAPFILELLIARAWRRAAVFIAAYAAIGLFWIAYWGLLYRWMGIPPSQAEAVGGAWFVSRVLALLSVDLSSAYQMAQSLARFVTWQNLLIAPLLVLALKPAFKAGGTMRALAIGIILTVVAMLVLVPSQTHGWGYRYLHGLIGSACLLAVFAWARLVEPLDARGRARAEAAFAAACLASLVVVFPVRAIQAYSFSHPFAVADADIRASKADVVLVDNWTALFDAGHFVRNDPFLRDGPKVMLLGAFREQGLTRLCGKYSVRVFDANDPAAKGIFTSVLPDPARARSASQRQLAEQLLAERARMQRLRAHLKSIGCGQG